MMTINTNVGQATIDFANFDEAKQYAAEHDMELYIMSKRDGHDQWTLRAHAFGAMDLINDWNWGDDADYPYYSGAEYIEKNRGPHYGETDLDEEELAEEKAWNDSAAKVAKQIDAEIHEGEFAIVNISNETVEIHPKQSMYYHDNDVHTYAIGCMKMF